MTEEEIGSIIYLLYENNEQNAATTSLNYASLDASCDELIEGISLSITEAQQKITDTTMTIDSMGFQQEYTMNVFIKLYSEFIEQENTLIEALESVKGDNENNFLEFTTNVNEYVGNLYEIRGFIVSYDQTFGDTVTEENGVTDTSQDFLVQTNSKESDKTRNELIEKLKNFSFLQKESNFAKVASSSLSQQQQKQNLVMGHLEKTNQALIQNIDAGTADHSMNTQLLDVLSSLISGLESQLEEMQSDVESVLSALDDTISYHEKLVEDVNTKLLDLDSESILIETTLSSEEDLLASYKEELSSFEEEMETEKSFCNEQLGFYEEQSEGK